MTVWIYSGRKMDADTWARQQGLRPRDCRTFGDRSKWRDGMRYSLTDRIIVLGDISHFAEAVIARCRAKSAQPPAVEYLPLPETPAPAR